MNWKLPVDALFLPINVDFVSSALALFWISRAAERMIYEKNQKKLKCIFNLSQAIKALDIVIHRRLKFCF